MRPSSSAKRKKERSTGTISGECLARSAGLVSTMKRVTSFAWTRVQSIVPSRSSVATKRAASVT
jgi:hypothetical protein